MTTNITKLKEKCSVIERCLPVSDFREQVAKTHSEMFEYIAKLEAVAFDKGRIDGLSMAIEWAEHAALVDIANHLRARMEGIK